MSTTIERKISIKDLMKLIKWESIYIQDWRSWIDIEVDDKQKLSDFQEFVIALDYIIENEYTNFQENCECDIDVSIDNWKDCKCEENEEHPFISACKAYEIYFNCKPKL